MRPERWRRLEALVQAALDLEPDEREAFLATAATGDSTLRGEAIALLAAEGKAGAFLRSATAPSPDVLEHVSANDTQLGTTLGGYCILRQIGAGGMGTVYLAERADGAFRRRVAIKVVAGDRAHTARLLRRFRREQHVLAGLDHPHVARLLEAGVTGDEQPYFVMEYVEGDAIDQWCDARRATLGQRIELICQVCAGVDAAHRRLVVHRDLKPANILVTREGVPKLLDFGIAKVLEPAAVGVTIEATATGLRPMSPRSASPEQILGDEITTATDVYALGVLLYQLLAGRRPHEGKAAKPWELARRIVQDEPVRPSQALDQCDSKPRTVGRPLRGDLDSIILKALRKEPDRRYGSAQQLAADLRRHLEGQPVLARDSTLCYRTGKFLRRHRWGVAALVAIFSLVLGSAALSWRQSVEIGRQRDRAEHQRDNAERVTKLMVGLFGAADPNESLDETTTVREALDRNAGRIEELASEPAIEAMLLHAVGRVYNNLGLFEQSISYLERAAKVRGERLGATAQTAESLAELGLVVHRQGDYPRAIGLLSDAAEIQERVLGPHDPALALSLHELSRLYRTTGRIEEAIEAGERSLAIRLEALGEDHIVVADSLNNLGILVGIRGDYAGAEPNFLRALEIKEAQLPPNHPFLARTTTSLAILYERTGRDPQAEQFFRRSIEIHEATMSEDHFALAHSRYNLGSFYARRGEYRKAQPLFERALTVREAKQAPTNVLLAQSRHALGRLYGVLGERERSRELFLRAAGGLGRLLEEDPGNREGQSLLASTQLRLGTLHAEAGDRLAAESLWQQAAKRSAEAMRETNVLRDLGIQAESLLRLGQVASAAPLVARLAASNWHSPELDRLARDLGLPVAAEDPASPGLTPWW